MATQTTTTATSDQAQPDDFVPPPLPRKVDTLAALEWLKRGWDDYLDSNFKGSFYGLVFALMGLLISWIYRTHWQFTTGLVAGFFLMGPFICTGLYELSRQRARGEPYSLSASLACWRRNLGGIAFFTVILSFAMIVWARVSVILFALSSTTDFPGLQGLLGSIFSLENPQFVLLWLGVGFVFASLVFAISVVSVPLLLDRNTDTMMAVFASVRTLFANPLALYVWAACIVVIIGVSLMAGLMPLIVTAPIVGHATWHAYQALLEPEVESVPS